MDYAKPYEKRMYGLVWPIQESFLFVRNLTKKEERILRKSIKNSEADEILDKVVNHEFVKKTTDALDEFNGYFHAEGPYWIFLFEDSKSMDGFYEKYQYAYPNLAYSVQPIYVDRKYLKGNKA